MKVRGQRAIRFLYNQNESCVCMQGTKSGVLLGRFGLHQGCPLSLILFVIFIDRILRWNQREEGFQFGDFFKDDTVVLISSDEDFSQGLSVKSDAMVFRPKWWIAPSRWRGNLCPK